MTSTKTWVAEVDRPMDEVVSWWQDLTFNLPRLRGATLGVRKTSPGPIGVGSRFEQRVQILGFETRIAGVVARFDPHQGGTFALEEGGIVRSGAIEVTFEPTATGTRITRRLVLEPRGVASLLWPILWPALVRRADIANRNIKRMIESAPRTQAQQGGSDPWR